VTALAPTASRRLPTGTTDQVMRRLFPTPSPYATDPVGFARQVLGVDPWSKQREILEAVRDHRRVAVRSGHGVGKTATAAIAVLWFHDTFADSRVISTAPTFSPGVKDLLWRDVRAFHSRALGAIRSKLLDTRLERGEKWFAEGYSTDKPERFQGHHAEHILYVVDEASGVDERIFEAGEGFLTSEHARVLLISNPTQPAGQFYRAFHSERDQWHTVHVSCTDAPAFTGERVSDAARAGLVTREWVDEKREQWGEDSVPFQVRVLGDFPAGSDDTVCALGDVEAAQARLDRSNGSPVVVGVDVARFGSDETVISVRRGNRVRVVHRAVGQDTMRTVGKALEVARDLAGSGTSPASLMRIVVDDTGVGGGVTDRLREIGHFQVIGFQAGAAAWTSDYPNRRSELWFSFSQRLRELDLDPADEQLAADLVAPRYQLDSRGRRVVEAKALTKKRLGRSPDSADSVLLTFAVPDSNALTTFSAGGGITSGLMERAW
jgi:phage terminase large subunit